MADREKKKGSKHLNLNNLKTKGEQKKFLCEIKCFLKKIKCFLLIKSFFLGRFGGIYDIPFYNLSGNDKVMSPEVINLLYIPEK